MNNELKRITLYNIDDLIEKDNVESLGKVDIVSLTKESSKIKFEGEERTYQHYNEDVGFGTSPSFDFFKSAQNYLKENSMYIADASYVKDSKLELNNKILNYLCDTDVKPKITGTLYRLKNLGEK